MWWANVLVGIYILDCVLLTVAVLLQPGKSDAAALFGGGGSQTAFGPRGTQNFLGWVTIVTAATFMVLGLVFSFPGVFGPSSVVKSAKEPAPAQQAAPSQAPAAVPPTAQPPVKK